MPDEATAPAGAPQGTRSALAEVATLFLRLGATAFGGPAAHIAMMEDEVVRRRRWLSREEFLDLLGATNLIPGPNSTELAIHVGHRRAGWPGLVVAGACFILPAFVIVSALAWGYVTWGRVPAAAGLLYGIKPVVIAVVLQALWGLGRSAVKSGRHAALGVAVVAAVLLGMHELLALAIAGVAGALLLRRRGGEVAAVVVPPSAVLPALPVIGGAAAGGVAYGLWPLFATFLKIGSVLYGSGYVLLAFLRADFVDRLGWLTEAQLLDAVAIGQVTPGPVFTTATFVGWILGGAPGAAVATVGIFLPAFVFVALSGPLVPRLRRSPTAGAVLDGVNVASLALMAVVTVALARAALVDAVTICIAVAGAIMLLKWRVNSAVIVLIGAVAGMLAMALGR